jgi:hypothetical protein
MLTLSVDSLIKKDNMQEQYQSLFDYLRKPAGTDLGKLVFTEAKKQNIKIQHKDVSNPNYTGKVMVYPTSFLENYFNPQPTQPNVSDDLPF